MNIIDRIGEGAAFVCLKVIDAGVKIKRGVLIIGEPTSRVMHDIYSLEGFEKWSKAIIADLKFISHIPAIKGVFGECLRTLEAQKDLYYATMFIGSTVEMMRSPRARRDIVKVLYAVGNFFETGKFFQKYKVFAFSSWTKASNYVSACKIYKTWTLDHIPVLNTVLERPKDICIFFASAIDISRTYRNRARVSLTETENLCKLIGNIGKMVLITFGRYYSKKPWFAFADVITQNASLIGFILKRERERSHRFNSPATAA